MERILRVVWVPAVIAGLLVPISDSWAQRRRSSSTRYRSYPSAKAIDGDTFRYKGQRYRVQTYNAPEIGQPGSRRATQSLQRQLDSGSTKWKPVARDKYGRTIVKPSRSRR